MTLHLAWTGDEFLETVELHLAGLEFERRDLAAFLQECRSLVADNPDPALWAQNTAKLW